MKRICSGLRKFFWLLSDEHSLETEQGRRQLLTVIAAGLLLLACLTHGTG